MAFTSDKNKIFMTSHLALYHEDIPVELRVIVMEYICKPFNCNADFQAFNKYYAMESYEKTVCLYGPIGCFDLSRITSINNCFGWLGYAPKEIEEWDVSSIKYMSNCFVHRSFHRFSPDLSKWDISNVVSMSNSFNHATFDALPGIQHWDMTNVTRRMDMLKGAQFKDKKDRDQILDWGARHNMTFAIIW